jgi:hypothetical protein
LESIGHGEIASFSLTDKGFGYRDNIIFFVNC